MKSCVATIGTFDGFHLGHRDLIARLLKEAAERNLESRIITFYNHPLEIICPEHAPKLIYSRDHTLELLKKSGVDNVSLINFTKDLQQTKAVDFMRLLKEKYGVKVLLMGYSNTLGSDRLSTHEDYIKAGKEAGVEVVFAEQFIEQKTGLVPSSSILRGLLSKGDLETFEKLADNVYVLDGIVIKGLQNGRKIGFPTFNIDYGKSMQLPAIGVYSGFVEVKGNFDSAVISVGTNPTIGEEDSIKIEAHAIDRTYENCYGEKIKIIFSRKIRNQRKFDSLTELKQAITEDIKAVN